VPLHKCSECGFLALRQTDTQELMEAPIRYRDHGNVPLDPMRTNREYAARLPICFVRKRDFSQSLRDWPEHPEPNSISPQDVLRLISEDYPCDDETGFTEWQQGFTPKEHREMLDREWRLKFEADEREKDRKWREEQRELDMEWRAQQEKEAADRHREQMNVLRSQHKSELRVFGLWVTAAIVISTILGSTIQAGWIGKPW